ncbi:uncharacterized protein PHACADRAFT_260199 [Phanerochaete carnosa HHB-10118-sp]|uniref:DUF6593 domain-containing protein n=1 Tax=Phanerochaete carnosa (strain HHB-10118-sp) TaxID=650164 RepID=K5W441_PHACS|nr:uncharacterized protein PHACADRAFT_260199 [Phanerochaete carnosa HHB-10118-sp]EKM53714.1 hypothetical protein PHACADRAFT_260199 [Phanerochaete carnosa HHB-10118-sp]
MSHFGSKSLKQHCGSVTYSFSQLTYRSMLLLPPSTSSDGRPLYHISVEVNCFRPGSHITVIRRGGSESGAYVGEYEIGLPARLNRVTIGPVAKMLMRPVLSWHHNAVRFESPRLRWNFDGIDLRWDPEISAQTPKGRTFKCTCPNPANNKALLRLATFHPPDPLRAISGARPMAMLTVEKEGQLLMDHILITALLLQQDSYLVS